MVEVRVMQRPDRSLYYEVLVASETMASRGLKFKGILEVKRESGEETRRKIGYLAGALAEELCEKYSDTIDPSNCAKAAIEAHRELMAENPHITLGDEAPRDADKSIAAGLARN